MGQLQPDIPALTHSFQALSTHFAVIAEQTARLHNLPALNNQVTQALGNEDNPLRTDLSARSGSLEAQVGDLQMTVVNGFADLKNMIEVLFLTPSSPARAANAIFQYTRLVDLQGNPLPAPFVAREDLHVATDAEIEGLRVHLGIPQFQAGDNLLAKKNIICSVLGIHAFRVNVVAL